MGFSFSLESANFLDALKNEINIHISDNVYRFPSRYCHGGPRLRPRRRREVSVSANIRAVKARTQSQGLNGGQNGLRRIKAAG